MTKYINVINKFTKRSVPFVVLKNGEIQIVSADPSNNEDTCIVVTREVFDFYSHDYNGVPERI